MKPTAKPIDGILLVNKPQGLTSNAVLQRVKHLYQAKKAGHTGSLDPLATGMLPICFGEATKFSQRVLDADKIYVATGRLGIKTTTADAMGEVTAQVNQPLNITMDDLQTALATFVGKSLQTPSMFSALKHQGRPLYHYARQGVHIERPPRPIEIKSLTLEHYDSPDFMITVHCSKGTYIRNLIEDIGDRLGVGAHVIQLHRAATVGFANHPMYSLAELMETDNERLMQYLLPTETAVIDLPSIMLDEDMLTDLTQGKMVQMQPVQSQLDSVRIYAPSGQFAGLGSLSSDGQLKVIRLVKINSELR